MNYSSDSLYRTLLQINNILVREVTPESLFRCLAKTLQPIIQYDRCSLSIYDIDTRSLSWFAQAEGIAVTRMDSANVPLRGPLALKAIHEGRPVLVPRLEAYGDNEAVRLMLAAGLRGSMAFPLVNRGSPIGALVYSFKRYLADEERELSGFLEKISTQVALAVENMLIHAKMNQRNGDLQQQVAALLREDALEHAVSRFFYQCQTMRDLMSQAHLLARSDAPVLIRGETGTGKEFIARFIHRHSPRQTHNFVKVNCPALSPTLFESELFGHAKGSFTGAFSSRIGRFELAGKGSIFLDEIGDLDTALQAKLLHVLQDGKLERVGESNPIAIDVRCISASNADLHHLMREGRFRRDLFYRLGVTTVQVPPLRDREGELPHMLRHLMQLHAQDMHCAPATIHPQAMLILERYHWPGNVRELSNLLARLLILHPGAQIGPEHVLPLLEQSGAGGEPPREPGSPSLFSQGAISLQSVAAQASAPFTGSPGGHAINFSPGPGISPGCGAGHSAAPASLANAEKAYIERALSLTNGKVGGSQGAAELLHIPRGTLQYKLKKHGISPRDFRKIKK